MQKSPFSYRRLQAIFRLFVRNEHLILVGLGLAIGCLSGGAVILLREGISELELLWFDFNLDAMARFELPVDWWIIVLAPAVGGLIVGLITMRFMPNGRNQGVAEVIEASAMQGGRMSSRVGIVSAINSVITLGSGGSAGREGPAVHLGASLAGWIARRLHLTQNLSRTILGCGVAAAVSASFNAPIAGALFATEVVVGQYALKTFAPIVVASVAGTALSHIYFGQVSVFLLGDNNIASFWEFPAFIGLGIVCAVAAVIMMHSIFMVRDFAKKLTIPPYTKPMLAGLAIGGIGVWFPQVLGVGYGFIEWAMLGQFELQLLILIGIAKIVATALTLGMGFSGGVFSPALVVGAAVGGAYGLIAANVFPELASSIGVYTVVGMGAVAASVLGAPISTTLIIFEMTGDYRLSLAVMLAIVISTEITHNLYGASFFAVQMRRRDIDLRDGFESELLRTIQVRRIIDHGTNIQAETIRKDTPIDQIRLKLSASTTGELFVVNRKGELFGTITLHDTGDVLFDTDCNNLLIAADVARQNPPVLSVSDTLDKAMQVMRDTGEEHIAVVKDKDNPMFVGCVHNRDVLNAYNRALIKVRHEEHNQ